MDDWWEFMMNKNFELIEGIELKDFLYPFALCLWIILIALPLHDVDRRDRITGAGYVIYCTACAVVFFLAMPSNYDSFSDLPVHLGFVSLFAGLSAYRWIRRKTEASTDASAEVAKKTS